MSESIIKLAGADVGTEMDGLELAGVVRAVVPAVAVAACAVTY